MVRGGRRAEVTDEVGNRAINWIERRGSIIARTVTGEQRRAGDQRNLAGGSAG